MSDVRIALESAAQDGVAAMLEQADPNSVFMEKTLD